VKHKRAQWQAQEAAQPPALDVVASGDEAAVAEDSPLGEGAGLETASAAAPAAAGTAAAPPPLKSVAYQPVPLS